MATDNPMTSYLEDGASAPAKVPATGAGNNPSTHAGLIVLASIALLLVARKSFRKFM